MIHRRKILGTLILAIAGCGAIVRKAAAQGLVYQGPGIGEAITTPLILRDSAVEAIGGGAKHPPECDKPAECRFSAGLQFVTAMYCGGPVYDRSGAVVSVPGKCNTTTTAWSCLTCGKTWEEVL